MSLSIKYINSITRTFVIRVGRDYVNILKASLAITSEFVNKKGKVRVVHMSGSIKKLELNGKK